MKNYKEILRLKSIGITNTQIVSSCSCSRTTVINTLKRAEARNLGWENVRDLSNEELAQKLMPSHKPSVSYQMLDYEYIHREMAVNGHYKLIHF